MSKVKAAHIEKDPKKKISKKIVFFLVLILLSIIILSYFYWEYVSPYWNFLFSKMEFYISKSPFLYSIYIFLKSNFASVTPLGIFLSFFFTSLFFFPPMPSELLFVGYLISNANPILLIVICSIASSLGQIVNYAIGYAFKSRLLKKESRSTKIQYLIQKLGGFILFFANVFPFPSEWLSLFFGIFKYKFKNFVIITIISRIVKFVLLFILFVYAKDYLLSLV